MKSSIRLYLVIVLVFLCSFAQAGEKPGIVELARDSGQFRFLTMAVERAGLTEALSAEGPLTVFAPSDSAFARLSRDDLTDLLSPGNREGLRRVLGLHVVSGRIGSPDLLLAKSVETLSGSRIPVAYVGGKLTVGGAEVVRADLACTNGVVHVLSSVILPAGPTSGVDEAARKSARHLLITAIEEGAPIFNRGDHAGCAGIYELAARTAVGGKGLTEKEKGIMSNALRSLTAAENDSRRAWILRRAFDRVLSGRELPAASPSLSLVKAPGFKVRVEAPLPKGFPGPGPVGEVIEKKYPRYRMARSEGGSNAFGTLFMHIKRNNIAMTAPVEMTMVPAGGNSLAMKDMAFLYESTAQGKAGTDGRVAVKDLERMTVLSVGLRGPMTAAKIALARAALDSALAARPELKRAGTYRQMGYNSPFISARDRFYELQLPVSRTASR